MLENVKIVADSSSDVLTLNEFPFASAPLKIVTAEKEYVPYIMPQEHGNHYGVKLLELGGFAFVSRQGFECNVSRYSAKELEAKQHNFELETDGLSHVRVDYKVSGIGSGSCGPQLREQYRLQDEKVKFAFSIVKL